MVEEVRSQRFIETLFAQIGFFHWLKIGNNILLISVIHAIKDYCV